MNELKAMLIVGYVVEGMRPYLKDDLIPTDEADMVLNELIMKVEEFLDYDSQQILDAGDRLFGYEAP